MIRIQPGQLENPQQMTVVVAGPDGASRLFILDGQLKVGLDGSGVIKERRSSRLLHCRLAYGFNDWN